MSSNVSTPYLEPHTSQTLPSLSPSPLAASPPLPLTPLDDIPPLELDVLTSHDDKVDALSLVADSIAQQRQQACLTLVTHPVLLGVLATSLIAVYRYSWVQHGQDLGTSMMITCGVVMTYLLAIRYFASGYLKAAEDLNWGWLAAEDGEEDVIIGTRCGQELVGALVLRLEPNAAPMGKKKNRSLSLRGGKGVIRAWTTGMRHRGRGVGEGILREAVRITRERCGRDAQIGFAKEHANSVRVLPDLFNGVFRRQEMKAAKALEAVVSGWEKDKRRR